MTWLTDLEDARDNVAARIKSITTTDLKPNYTIDGQQMSWQSLYDSLTASLTRLNADIASGDPYEEVSQAYTPDDCCG